MEKFKRTGEEICDHKCDGQQHSTEMLSWSVLCHYNQEPNKNSLKEDTFILAHGFRGFGTWLVGSNVCAWGKAGRHGGKHVLEQSNSHLSTQEAERDKKGLRTQYVLPGHTFSALFPPSRPCLSTMPSYHEFMQGLIHWLVQSPQF
jgi:hypothetical protein